MELYFCCDPLFLQASQYASVQETLLPAFYFLCRESINGDYCVNAELRTMFPPDHSHTMRESAPAKSLDCSGYVRDPTL